MSPEPAHSRWPGRVAVGIVRSDPPEVFLAEDEFVLSRVLALKVVAASRPEDFDLETLERIRSSLLAERWAEAVGAWIGAGGDAVDGYPDEVIWTDRQLDEEVATMEIWRRAHVAPSCGSSTRAASKGVGRACCVRTR